MTEHWTFSRKIAVGYAAMVVLSLILAAVSVYALRNVVASKDRVITVNANLLLDAQRLSEASEAKSSAGRGFLLTREPRLLDEMQEVRGEFATILARLTQNVATEDGRKALEQVERAEARHQQMLDRVIALRRTEASVDTVGRAFEQHVVPARKQLSDALAAFVEREERRLAAATQASTDIASATVILLISVAAGAVLLAFALGLLLSRALGRQIGTAVGHVQNSSAELQAAAHQQVTGTKEQATAMNEITTTISELLATSRQIAESAQRVAAIAEKTVASARTGEQTVEQAHESIVGIRRQVDMIVNHMLELGKKSQQIGSVLEIVSELAEQTNILAINATIEAAGAGEAGRRFAVVAEEIRGLADRVANSAKEIRALIEDVRGAVNTTVMATETGSKAVDAGSREFGEVASAFKQIAALVATTTEAAREIELSTKQQASAIEQVNVAIANVAQTTKESEVSSGQTLETVSQLALLSRDLLRLVRSQAAAA